MIYVHLYLWMNNIVHLLCGSNTWHGSALKPGCTGLRSSTWWITQWTPWEACPNLNGAPSKLAKYQMAITRNMFVFCVCVCVGVTIWPSREVLIVVSVALPMVFMVYQTITPTLNWGSLCQCNFKLGKPADLAGSHGDTAMECYGDSNLCKAWFTWVNHQH